MRDYINNKNLGAQIKAGLQVCYKVLNKDKHPESEYRLFSYLAESYLQEGNIREYPKVAAIYQYLKKLVEKSLNGDKEKLESIERRVRAVELRFLEKLKVLKSDIKDREQEITDIGSYKEELVSFRERIKKELLAIENLGIEKDKEELNEEGLQKRAQEVERIYMGISEFFIGKRDEAGELTKSGLVNKLIEGCIIELGGLPRVGKDNHECDYAIFGMGSLALGTMTPWSDLEFGILIEDGLSKDEEERVKEYFRNLTSLLHIKVVNFGETILPAMGIKELNNFKLIDTSDHEHNWFYDSTIPRGFSFDGANWHACKTPLGRKGYLGYKDFEILCTPGNLSEFQQKICFERDEQLLQSLAHVVLIAGKESLLNNYCILLKNNYKTEIKEKGYKILQQDIAVYDPIIKLDKKIGQEGSLFDVKKEIYRFLDRVLVAIGDCLDKNGHDQWQLIDEICKLNSAANLKVALSIAAELRIRNYSFHAGQREKLFAFKSVYPNTDNNLLEKQIVKFFHLKNIELLKVFFYVVTDLSNRIYTAINLPSSKLSEVFNLNFVLNKNFQNDYIKGLVNYRMLNYKTAVEYFSLAIKKYELSSLEMSRVLTKIAYCNSIIGEYSEAIVHYEKVLETQRRELGEKHSDYAGSLNNLGTVYGNKGDYVRAMDYYKQALNLLYGKADKKREYAIFLNNLGVLYKSKGDYTSSFKCHTEALEIEKRLHGESNLEYAGSLNNLGIIYKIKGNYTKAIECYKKALEIKKTLLGERHPDYVISLENLGAVLAVKGEFAKAVECHLEALAVQKEVLGEEHSFCAGSLNNLANVYISQGHYAKAIGCYKKALRILNKTLGEKHSDYITTFNNLGAAYLINGNYSKAIKFHEKALKIQYEILGEKHLDCATSLNNLGAVYLKNANYVKAIEYYGMALEIQKQALGKLHSDNGISYNNLGVAYRSKGDYAQAIKYHLLAVKVQKRTLEHPDYATSLSNLGTDYRVKEDYVKAIKYLVLAIKVQERVLGARHPDYAVSLNNIGVVYRNKGDYKQAIKYHKQALEIQKAALGKKHPDYANTLNNMGLAYRNEGDYEQAIKYHKQALEIQKAALGKKHPDYANSLISLGIAYDNKGETEKAIERIKKALQIQKEMLGDKHIDCVTSLNNLGMIYSDKEEYDKAIAFHNEALEIQKETLGKDHPECAVTFNNLGMVYDKKEEYTEAIDYYKEALRIQREALRTKCPNYAAFLSNLGMVYDSIEEYEKAIECYKEALEIQKEILGDKNLDYATTLCNLGATYQNMEEFGRAVGCYEQALEIRGNILGEEHIFYLEALKVFYSACTYLVNDYSLNKIELAIEYQKRLNKRLPYDRGLKHNLACFYHIQALKFKSTNNYIAYKENISIAKKVFETAILMETSKPIEASLYVEYAQFLVKNFTKGSIKEYNEVKHFLRLAIELKEDDSELSYGKIEKSTTVDPIQELLDAQDEVVVKPYLLAYYLLIKVHCLHNNKEQAEEALKEFSSQAELLKVTEDDEKALHFYNWSCKEVESLKHGQKEAGFGDKKDDQDKEFQKLDNEQNAALIVQRSWRKYIESRKIVSRDKSI